MRASVLFLALSLGTGATAFAVPVAPPSVAVADTVRPVSKELHDNVVTLVELLGIRQHLLDSRTTMAAEGKQEILRRFPNYDPAFADEWAKQMAARMPVDDYVKIVVAAYEKNYSNQDVLELIQMQRDLKVGKTASPSPRLREKIGTAGMEAQSEIMGGFTQLGSKLGGEIGIEIAKEHPEWLSDPDRFVITPAN
jgi:hypothetical protein